MKIGAHGWVYAATMPGYDYTPRLAEIFADIQYAGINGFELMEIALRHKDAVSRIRALSEQYGIAVLGTSYGADMWNTKLHDKILRDAEIVIQRLGQLKGRTFGASVGQAPGAKTADQLDAQAKLLITLDSMCAAENIQLNFHNHTHEVENECHDLRGTLQRFPGLKLGPDLNWMQRAGVDPVWFLKTFAKNIVFLHFRDQTADGRWTEALGEGDMDHKAIAETLKAIDYSGDFVIELAHEADFQLTRPLRDSWRNSRKFLQTLMT